MSQTLNLIRMKFTLLSFVFGFCSLGFFASGQDVKNVAVSNDSKPEQNVISVKNRKYGMVTRDGNVVIPFEFDSLSFLSTDLIRAQKKGKTGGISLKNKIVIPFIYDDVEVMGPYYVGFLKTRKKNKYGAVTSDGDIISAPAFDAIEWQHNIHAFPVMVNNKLGALNREGKIVIEPKITGSIHDMIQQDKVVTHCIFKSNGRFGVATRNGDVVVPAVYSSLYYESSLNVLVSTEPKPNSTFDKLHGLIDLNNKGLAPIYDMLIPVTLNFIIAGKDKKAGIIDISGNQIVPFTFDAIQKVVYKDNCKTCKTLYYVSRDRQHGLMDENGQVLTDIKYSGLWPEGIFFLTWYQGKYGLVDQAGKHVLDNLFTEIKILPKLNRIIAVAGQNSDFKLFDSQGVLLTESGFDNIEEINSKNFFSVKKEGKRGLINQQGQLIVPPSYDQIFSKGQNENKIYGMKNGQYVEVATDTQ